VSFSFFQAAPLRRSRNTKQGAQLPVTPSQVVGDGSGENAVRFAESAGFLADLAHLVRENKLRNGMGGKLVGAGGLLAVLAGAAELADQNDDPLAEKIARAVGVTGGNLGGGLAGAMAGTAVGGPIGGVIGGVLGATGGGAAGKGIMSGLYGLVTNEDPQDKELSRMARQERLQQQLKLEAMKNAIPIQQELMRLKQADDFERLKMQLAVNKDYNFANTMNTAALNAQQDAATQQALMTQYLYS